MRLRPLHDNSRKPRYRPLRAGIWLAALLLVLPLGAQEKATEPEAGDKTTGWVCGGVVDETFSFVTEAELTLFPAVEPGAAEPAPVGRAPTDAHGAFCLQDLPPGFYQLRVAKAPWPIQTPRTVEVRAGLLNRLLPIELELEPGEPRVSYWESFEGMSPGEARGLMERLLKQSDAASLQELTRRLLPKRGPRFDLGRLVMGLDVKPLTEELMRQLETGYFPPLKTARYIFVLGELMDSRTRDLAVPVLLRKLHDARRLPPSPYTAVGETGKTGYVSDEAIYAMTRLSGKDFGWKYGLSPLQNEKSIQAAFVWWRQDVERRDSRRR